jgi:hypothetical protein
MRLKRFDFNAILSAALPAAFHKFASAIRKTKRGSEL